MLEENIAKVSSLIFGDFVNLWNTYTKFPYNFKINFIDFKIE